MSHLGKHGTGFRLLRRDGKPCRRRGAALRGPWLRAVLLAAAALSAVTAARAAEISRADYLAGDLEALERSVAGGVSQAERLLVRTLRVRDADAVLNFMRAIASLEGPDWVRGEALRALCEYFCVMEMRDSLEARVARLKELSGEDYRCALLREHRPVWCVQLGAFSSAANAERQLAALAATGAVTRVYYDGEYYRALAGEYAGRGEARDAARGWAERGLISDFRLYRLQPAGGG